MCHTMMCQFQDHKGDCSIDVAKYQEKHNMSPCDVGCSKYASKDEEVVLLRAKMNGYAFTLKHDYSLTYEEIYEISVNRNLTPLDRVRESIDFALISKVISLQEEIERIYKLKCSTMP